MSNEKEPVGSVADEAAKLLAALQGWAKDTGGDHAAASAEGAAQSASAIFREINEHIATDGANCKYCPLCQVISTARQLSPEVKEHLASATTSLLRAIIRAMARDVQDPTQQRSGPPVEKIDLSDDGWEDDE